MPDILLDVPIKADAEQVFNAFTTPEGLNRWWTKQSQGKPIDGEEYHLHFGPGYDWHAKVTRVTTNSEFDLEMTDADSDWMGTHVGCKLESRDGVTWLRFYHTGWPDANEHYRISCNCWAMYLRILRRYLEHGEVVPYEQRLDV